MKSIVTHPLLLLYIAGIPQISYSFSFTTRSSTFAHKRTTLNVNENNNVASKSNNIEEVDVIVVGAGIGGLSCAALCAKYNLKTLCLEAHDSPGGCAHSFERIIPSSKLIDKNGPNKVIFDSGPSLLSGMESKSTNPLRQVLDALDVTNEIAWCNYDGWVVHDTGDGKSFRLTTGSQGKFESDLEDKAGMDARQQFESFRDMILSPGGLAEASAFIPPFALRGGISAAYSLSRYFLKFLSIGAKGTLLTGPFSTVMNKYGVTDSFVRKWFDYLSFALSGLDAAHTQAAPVVYTMSDLHKEGACLNYPMGGMGAIIDALISGLTKYGGDIRLNSRVSQFILSEEDKAQCDGVVLTDGTIIRARKAVVCNAPLWNMAKILSNSIPDTTDKKHILQCVEEIQGRANNMNKTGSFMHLHLAVPSEGIPDDLDGHHSVLNFDLDVIAPQNLVIISIPTIFDKSLAPPGYHIVHAYTAASEDYSEWEDFLTSSVTADTTYSSSEYKRTEEYMRFKEEKAEALWKALERVIPDIRERASRPESIVLTATPLTHRRYISREYGTYGPAPSNGKDVWNLAGALTSISGLLACGDTCFPGIGLPGVAASGTIAANTVTDVKHQMNLMKELRSTGALQ